MTSRPIQTIKKEIGLACHSIRAKLIIETLHYAFSTHLFDKEYTFFMGKLDHLLDKNSEWAAQIKAEDPHFFSQLAAQQTPEILWIGCSDSRVPSNQIVGMLPGEIFVHRNIANTVVHTDLNCLSVLFYAVSVLKVKHIIVCGHYGCGGVQAALQSKGAGLVDHWLRNIRDVYYAQKDEFTGDETEEERINKLCELNVVQQVANVTRTTVVQEAWNNGQELTVHGWIYAIADGLLKPIAAEINSPEQIPEQYRIK